MVGAHGRHDAEIRFRIEIRHFVGTAITAGTHFQSQLHLHTRCAVDAFATGQLGFEAVVAITEMGRADSQSPLAAFIGPPAYETATAVRANAAVERPQRGIGREIIQAAAVLPVVVDVPRHGQPRALLVAGAIGVIGDLRFQRHVPGATLHAQALPAMVAGAFLEITGGVAGTAE
ncbi:hypothetical protein D3C78_1159800 [compost metagenome]